MNQYWEQDTPVGMMAVEIQWSAKHQHYHCFIWHDPNGFATLKFASTVGTLDHYVEVARDMGIEIPSSVIATLVDDRGRMRDTYKTFITTAEYNALPKVKRIADLERSIDSWTAQGWEAERMGDKHWAQTCAQKAAEEQVRLSKLISSSTGN